MNFMTIPSDFKWTDLDLKQLNSLDIEEKKISKKMNLISEDVLVRLSQPRFYKILQLK